MGGDHGTDGADAERSLITAQIDRHPRDPAAPGVIANSIVVVRHLNRTQGQLNAYLSLPEGVPDDDAGR